jgi:ABC-2 type transport system permease protein
MSTPPTAAGDLTLPGRPTPKWILALEMMWATATFDFRRRYAETALGLAWGILEPILYSLVCYMVFTRGLRFGGNVPHYVAMLMLNIMLFRGFREGAKNAMVALVQKRAMVGVRVPRIVIIFSGILSGLLLMFIGLPVGFAWIIETGVHITLTWLLFPVLLLYLLLVIVVIGFVLAAFYARWRDTQLVWGLYQRVLFLSSGVIFPYELIRGGTFQAIAAFNPLAPVFVQARVWFIDPTAPTWPEAAGSPLSTAAPFIVLGALAVLALLVFRPFTRRVAETV